jgi:hypothetical protein
VTRPCSIDGSSVEILSTPVDTLPKVGDVAVSAIISGQHYIFLCPTGDVASRGAIGLVSFCLGLVRFFRQGWFPLPLANRPGSVWFGTLALPVDGCLVNQHVVVEWWSGGAVFDSA